MVLLFPTMKIVVLAVLEIVRNKVIHTLFVDPSPICSFFRDRLRQVLLHPICHSPHSWQALFQGDQLPNNNHILKKGRIALEMQRRNENLKSCQNVSKSDGTDTGSIGFLLFPFLSFEQRPLPKRRQEDFSSQLYYSFLFFFKNSMTTRLKHKIFVRIRNLFAMNPPQTPCDYQQGT